MKGHTKIELTNTETGVVETIESDNLITNGVRDYFNNLTPRSKVCDDDGFTMLKHMYGGINLFDKCLEENPDNYYPLYMEGVSEIGYSYLDRTSSRNNAMGIYNSSESVITNDELKMVFDFPTNVANGTISSICLSPIIAAWTTFGIKFELNRDDDRRWAQVNNYASDNIEIIGRPIYADENYIYSFNISSDLEYDVYRYINPRNTIYFKNPEFKLLKTFSISDKKYAQNGNRILIDHFRFVDKKIYFIFRDNTNPSIMHIEISDLDTLDTTVINYDFGSIDFAESINYNLYFVKNNKIYILDESGQETHNSCVFDIATETATIIENTTFNGVDFNHMTQVSNQYLYFYNSNKKLKINGNDLSVVYTNAYGGDSYDLYYRFYCDATVRTTYNTWLSGNGKVDTPCWDFLSTINNLETPIIKTDKKTMKITYTLTLE